MLTRPEEDEKSTNETKKKKKDQKKKKSVEYPEAEWKSALRKTKGSISQNSDKQ